MRVDFKILIKIAACSLVIFSLGGCSSSGVQSVTGEPVTNVFETFKRGEARLNCEGVSCAGAWGSAKRESKALYDQELWNDLVNKVASVGYRTDLTYFYLGRAAEGLGYYPAARQYYGLANASFKCDGFVNNCNGLVFPRDIVAGLNRLPKLNESPAVDAKKEAGDPSEGSSTSSKGASFSSSKAEVQMGHGNFDVSGGSKSEQNIQEDGVVSGDSQDDLNAWFAGAEAGDGRSMLLLALHYQKLSWGASKNTSKYKEIAFSLYALGKRDLPNSDDSWKDSAKLLYGTMTPNDVVRAKGLAYIMMQRGVKHTIDEYL